MKLKDIIKYITILFSLVFIVLLMNKGGAEIQAFTKFLKSVNEGHEKPAVIIEKDNTAWDILLEFEGENWQYDIEEKRKSTITSEQLLDSSKKYYRENLSNKNGLHQLKTIDLPKIIKIINQIDSLNAGDKGDLSENNEYIAAKKEQGLLESKIAKLEEDLVKEFEKRFSFATIDSSESGRGRKKIITKTVSILIDPVELWETKVFAKNKEEALNKAIETWPQYSEAENKDSLKSALNKFSKVFPYIKGDIYENGLLTREDWKNRINSKEKKSFAESFLKRGKDKESKNEDEGPAFLMLSAEEQEKEIEDFIKTLDDSIESENNIISPFVTGALALCIGTFILALVFSMIKMFDNRKTMIRTLIVFSGLIGVFIISYLLNSDQATTLETNVSAALTSLWILLGLSILAIIYSEITKLFSR